MSNYKQKHQLFKKITAHDPSKYITKLNSNNGKQEEAAESEDTTPLALRN